MNSGTEKTKQQIKQLDKVQTKRQSLNQTLKKARVETQGTRGRRHTNNELTKSERGTKA